MNILNRIINWFYKDKILKEKSEINLIPHSNKPIDFIKYNPTSGLPMVGGLDVSGNLYGTYRIENYTRYHR